MNQQDEATLRRIAQDPIETQKWMAGFALELENSHITSNRVDAVIAMRTRLGQLSVENQSNSASTIWGEGERP
jgi:hypothetical protein